MQHPDKHTCNIRLKNRWNIGYKRLQRTCTTCNTRKFVLLKIGLKWFIYKFLCTWNIGKRIFFIILKFIIRSSNTDVHTCRCIWFIAMSGWIQNSKWIQIAFEIKFEKGYEIKEKKRKRELENKRDFKSLQKFSFGNLSKVLI